ncbi:MAG: CBS domain-containing protein, partial [Candidatus Binatia bacterium]
IRDAYPTSMMINRGKEIDSFAGKITVEEVMTHDLFIVRPETPLAAAVALLRRHRIGSLPVVKDRQLIGIITRSDILDFVLSGGRAPALRKTKIPIKKAALKKAKSKRK